MSWLPLPDNAAQHHLQPASYLRWAQRQPAQQTQAPTLTRQSSTTDAAEYTFDYRAKETLGSAMATSTWRWAPTPHTSPTPMLPQTRIASAAPNLTSKRQPAHTPTMLHAPRALVAAMSAAAQANGSSESELWAQAAAEWLINHNETDDTPPPSPAALARPRPPRAWQTIDALLIELRHTTGGFSNEVAASYCNASQTDEPLPAA